VFIHANFVEALLDQRTFEPVPEWIVATLEVVLVLVCIIVFGLDVRTRTKFATCTFAFFFLIIANYLALQNLGRFFDFFVPLVVIMSHVAFDQVNDWRHKAHAHRRCSPCVAVILLLATLASPPLLADAMAALVNRTNHSRVPNHGTSVAQTTNAGVESADPAKPGGPRHDADPVIREIEPMGPEPVVREGVEAADPTKPGGAKQHPDPIVDPMGPEPVVREGVEAAKPAYPGGPRHDGDATRGQDNR
jgi:hypothetical protein